MRVRWNDRSKKQLRKTANYIGKKFGVTAKRDFLQDMGPLEMFLADLPSMYRSIVVRHHNKIVYHIVDDHIEVVAFWDTRREPKAQSEQVKNKSSNL